MPINTNIHLGLKHYRFIKRDDKSFVSGRLLLSGLPSEQRDESLLVTEGSGVFYTSALLSIGIELLGEISGRNAIIKILHHTPRRIASATRIMGYQYSVKVMYLSLNTKRTSL